MTGLLKQPWQILLRQLVAGAIVLGLAGAGNAGEAPGGQQADISTHYRITTTSLQSLPELLASRAADTIGSVSEELALDAYIAALTPADYADILASFVRQQDVTAMAELVDAELARFYELYIDNISDAAFADIYREYLGELTASYLTTAATQDFTQYVLSRILRLSPAEYSSLYRNYILTLWRYYVADTSEEDLRALLGDDYAALTSTDNLVIDDERYFDMLVEHLTTIDESRFISEYRAYVTETIGGLVEAIETTGPNGAAADPADQDADQAGAETQTDAEPVSTAGGFTQLSPAESIGLLRRHIASIARSYFLGPFRADLLRDPVSYVNSVAPETLAGLAALPELMAIVERRLAEYNARVRTTNAELAELQDAAVLEAVTAELRFVANIPYPNLRLLRIAVDHALSIHVRQNPVLANLTEVQYQALMAAIMDAAVMFGADGLAAEPAANGQDTADPGGERSWSFLGCGCEIEQSRVIYGFYPTWSLPQPGSGAQEIDFRFYDRVAYFGLTLDASGRISDDEFWRAGGDLNDFIQGAHVRNTRIDLGVYAPYWDSWTDANMNIAATNIVDKLSIPLQFNVFSTFANTYLAPVYPTYSETVGKNTMGDGLTLYFDSLEDPVTRAVRDLEMIERFVLRLDSLLETEFPVEEMPIHLVLDFDSRNTAAILTELGHLISGTPDSPNEFVSRVMIFLEQDTWDSSQNLIRAVRTVFRNNNSAAVLQKMNPILIPAMDEPGHFASLERDLRDFRFSFGERGGAAIWPIPLQGLEEDRLIKEAFDGAMVDSASGLWASFESTIQHTYFRARLELIFTMTLVYVLALLIFAYSIREPVKPWILWTAKILGVLSFVMMLVSWRFLDPYINPWRVVFFVASALLVLLIPFQPAIPEAQVDLTQNRFVDRQIKRQKNRGKRLLRTRIRNLWRNRGGD